MDGSQEERPKHVKTVRLLRYGKVQIASTGEGVAVHDIEEVGGEKLFELIQSQATEDGEDREMVKNTNKLTLISTHTIVFISWTRAIAPERARPHSNVLCI